MIFVGPTIIALGAAIATGCEVFIVKDDGEKININEMTTEKYQEMKGKFEQKTKETDEKEE